MTIGYAVMPVIPSLKGMDATIQKELSRIGPKLGQAAGVNLGEGINQGAGSKLSKLGDVVSTGLKAGVVAGGALAVAAGGWGLKIAAANEQAEISFTTMLGSAQKARSFLDELKAFAAKTPFEFPELQTAASSLISAGVEASKVIPIMTTLGDVTAGMGTGSEGIKRATVALQQMQAAGKITGEDLNQLRDAGIPVYDLLAAATGKAKTEVTALAQAGKLGKTELDQLMGGLESGKGLERFSGLMDKQSQSLTGMISTLKDTTGQLLATAMTPLVSLAKQGLPLVTEGIQGAFDAADRLAPKLTDARDAFADVVGQVQPAAAELGHSLVPVLEDLVDIAGGVLPPALRLAGDGLTLVVDGATGVVKVIQPLTSLLADHEEIVLGVAAAYLGWKAAGFVDSTWSGATGAAKGLSTQLGYVRDSISDIAATQGVSKLAASAGVARASLSEVAGSVSILPIGLAAAATAASTFEQGLAKAHAQAQATMDALKPTGGVDPASITSLTAYAGALGKAYSEAERNKDATNDFLALTKGSVELLTPMENKILDNAVAAKDLGKAYDVADKAARRWIGKVSDVSDELGISGGQVEAWVHKLNLDPATTSASALADAIDKARAASANNNPKIQAAADLMSTLADDTADATDRISAWKDALDAALGKPLDIASSETQFRLDLLDAEKRLKAGAWGGLRSDTEVGLENQQAIQRLLDEAQRVSDAYASAGKFPEAALKLEEARRMIEDLGSTSGVSRDEIHQMLEQLQWIDKDFESRIKIVMDDQSKRNADAAARWYAAASAGAFGNVELNASLGSPGGVHGSGDLHRTGGRSYRPMSLDGIKQPAAASAAPRPGRSGFRDLVINAAPDTRAITTKLLWEQGR